jgi:hypothetical protein
MGKGMEGGEDKLKYFFSIILIKIKKNKLKSKKKKKCD